MTPASVVEELDVIEYVSAGFPPIRVNPSSDSLTFEQLEEALRYGVVVTVAPPAHAAHETVGLEKVLPVVTAELASLVGMDDDRAIRLAPPHGHHQRVHGQLTAHGTSSEPSV